jgi:hypothetical protein
MKPNTIYGFFSSFLLRRMFPYTPLSGGLEKHNSSKGVEILLL